MLTEHHVVLHMGGAVPEGVTAMFSRRRFYQAAVTWGACTSLEFEALRFYYLANWHRDTAR